MKAGCRAFLEHMELQYETTAEDYLFLFGQYAKSSAVAERFIRFTFVVIPCLAWLSTGLFYFKQHHQNNYWIFYAIFASFLTVCIPKLYSLYQDSFWKSVLTPQMLKGLIGQTKVILTEDGIQEVTDKTIHHARWEEIERVEVVNDYILIFLAPLLAIIVPPGAFVDTAGRSSFEEKLRGYQRKTVS